MFELGAVVAGKYQIESVLGEGGMGIVVGATHLALGTPVALKFLHGEMARKPAVVERFLREARASAQLRSENVCRVSDVGTLDNGVPYLVMERLIGGDLGSFLNASGPLPPALVAEYVIQACAGLAEAHAAGIVHRDLKPGNLFLTRRTDGTTLIKVLDFGVAKAPEVTSFSLTQTSNVMGSPGYMSPEQLKSSKEVDARSDIWSLGIVMYELLVGRQPFLAETITELALRVAMDPTPPLPPTAPAPLGEIIARCLEKDPSHRYANVAELAAALAGALGPAAYDAAAVVARVLHGAGSPMITPPPSPSVPTTLRSASGMVTALPRRSNKRMAIVVGAGVAAGVLGILLVTALGGGDGGGGSSHEAAPVPVTPMKAEPAPEPAPAPAAAPAPANADVAKPEPAKPDATRPDARPAKPKLEAAKPTKPKVDKPAKPKPEDVGESRF